MAEIGSADSACYESPLCQCSYVTNISTCSCLICLNTGHRLVTLTGTNSAVGSLVSDQILSNIKRLLPGQLARDPVPFNINVQHWGAFVEVCARAWQDSQAMLNALKRRPGTSQLSVNGNGRRQARCG